VFTNSAVLTKGMNSNSVIIRFRVVEMSRSTSITRAAGAIDRPAIRLF
jgi:hypothetical protein